MKKNSFTYDELISCGNGELFGPGNAKLPGPKSSPFPELISSSYVNEFFFINYAPLILDLLRL